MELSGSRIFTVGALAVVVVLGLGGLVAWGAGAFDGDSPSPAAVNPGAGAGTEFVLDGTGDSCGGCPFTGEKSGTGEKSAGMSAAIMNAGASGCADKAGGTAMDACGTDDGCGGCEEMPAAKASCGDGGSCCGGESCGEEDGKVTEQVDN